MVLCSPVLVYGRTIDDTPFHDMASILTLHARGGVLALAVNVQKGESILLVNPETQEDRECRVVYVGPEDSGTRKVCFEFVA